MILEKEINLLWEEAIFTLLFSMVQWQNVSANCWYQYGSSNDSKLEFSVKLSISYKTIIIILLLTVHYSLH